MATVDQIRQQSSRTAVPFQLAEHLRKILDDAREAYGAKAWLADDVETQIQDLVFSDQ